MRTNQNRTQENQNNFGVKYDDRKAEWINNIPKDLQTLEGPEVDIHLKLFRATQKKIPILKCQAMMTNIESRFIDSYLKVMTNCFFN